MSKSGLAVKTKIMLTLSLGLVAVVTSLPPASANLMGGFSWAQNQLKTQLMSDAMKTMVTQDALGSMQLGETTVVAKQNLISAEDMLLKKSNLVDLYTDYMASSANPSNSNCVALNTRLKESKISKRVTGFVTSDIINNMNSSSSIETQRVGELNDIKSSVACTLELAKQGFCTATLSTGQYYDVDYGMVLSNERLDEAQFIAAKSGVLSIANPIPDGVSEANCTEGKSCTSALNNQNNKLAVNSLVVNSLLTQVYNRLATGVPQ